MKNSNIIGAIDEECGSPAKEVRLPPTKLEQDTVAYCLRDFDREDRLRWYCGQWWIERIELTGRRKYHRVGIEKVDDARAALFIDECIQSSALFIPECDQSIEQACTVLRHGLRRDAKKIARLLQRLYDEIHQEDTMHYDYPRPGFVFGLCAGHHYDDYLRWHAGRWFHETLYEDRSLSCSLEINFSEALSYLLNSEEIADYPTVKTLAKHLSRLHEKMPLILNTKPVLAS